MKHLLIVLVLLAVGYGTWYFFPKAKRDKGVRQIFRHSIRFGILVAAVLALLAFFYYANSTRIL